MSNMTITDKQLKWFRENHADIERARGEHNEIIAEALTTAYNQMSELENLLNDGMANAGEAQYGLSRNDIHNRRIQIRSMARQFGMKMTEYPINLMGGTYTEED